MKKIITVTAIVLAVLACACAVSVVGINIYINTSTQATIYAPDTEIEDKEYDCIIVLGAGVKDGKPSDMLKDRLLTAIKLYEDGVAPKLLMSGDHGQADYDEVNVMKSFAIEQGVPSEDIFMDHAGFSTYESICRAKEIFEVDTAVIVSQEYHLPRALHIARQLGVDAVGVYADTREYTGELYRGVREILARYKDFFKCVFTPEPTHSEDKIPISGNGDVTNDK